MIYRIFFNIWVVKNVFQNNSLSGDFGILSKTAYNYFGGKYDYEDSEFRGFNIVNETLSDNSKIVHYFHQSKILKGKEFKTETFDSGNNIFSKTESNYNFTTANGSYYVVNLLSSITSTYDGNSINPKITNITYKYDNYSNILSRVMNGDVSLIGDEKYENYTYVYNQTSWILDKPSWYILFDNNHNKIRESKYFYDDSEYGDPPTKGDLTKIENWLDTGGGDVVIYYQYDDFGNLYRQTDALGRPTTTHDYGSKDDTRTYPDRITNALGHSVDYEYDVATGNVLSYTKHGVKFDYVYDNFSRIVKDIDPYDTSDFPTKKYIYDFDGIAPEIIKVSQRTTSNNTIDTFYYYDGFANLVQIKTPADNGQQVVKNLFYDGLFRVKEEQIPYFDIHSTILANKSNTTNTSKYNYDAVGRITSVINSDGTIKNTTYNKWEINDYDENRNRHTYLLDAYDRIIAVTEYNTDFYLLDNETYNTTYSYNGADELVGIRDTFGNEFNFSYDSLGRKIKLIDPDLGIWTYTYDSAGNLISQVGGGGNLVTGDSYYREYNGLGQLKSVKEGNNSNGRILEEYFYDSNGDRIRVNRYSYTGGTNETIYTPYKEWMQIRNSSGIHNFYYIYQDGTLVARQNPDGTKWFYHSDHLGSTDLITDENGNVVEDEFYSPFGESLNTNDNEEFKLYTGQFKDTIDCQYYYGARYYLVNPPIFASGDPIIQQVYDPQFLNHYAYSRNNPYKLIDVDGREVYIILQDTNILGINTGHIEFVVRDPDQGGYRFYSNEGPKSSYGKLVTYGRAVLALDKSEYKTNPGDAKSAGVSKDEAFPKSYKDSFRIETTEQQDQQIIDKANEIVANPKDYSAFTDNSQDFVIEALGEADIELKRHVLLPKKTFSQNEEFFKNFDVPIKKLNENKKSSGSGGGGGGGSTVDCFQSCEVACDLHKCTKTCKTYCVPKK